MSEPLYVEKDIVSKTMCYIILTLVLLCPDIYGVKDVLDQ